MKYIAYGSNMSQEQMAFRCPNARLIGTGYLPNHQLEFYLHATVERKREASPGVPVAVWEIDAEDEKRLDRYEGFPTYYIKRQATVHMDDGSKTKGMLYQMNRNCLKHSCRHSRDFELRLKRHMNHSVKCLTNAIMIQQFHLVHLILKRANL